ncbi:type III pantothenate kinase [Pseudoalteromonas sp. BDTF-M6]|uniref:type III pantothenate kinase n=1 Tax=Pseudoalteromonas sp. BDTF-M6 TaxID=2796132 RepID=UPI001BAF2F33|nr:type III pantothenate kinase [Pseudoalteromonas sp. BDTF-M6]MBS3797113.1 type III pantothenate kinase [Pseudoalteromonas sp. BDTF-M6]
MKLLIDAGNTALKMMLASGPETEQDIQLQQVEPAALPWTQIDEVVVSAVADSDALNAMVKEAEAHGVGVRRAKVAAQWLQLSCAYNNYHTLGIDRWLAVIAGYCANPNGYTLVVDAGTALTLDLIDDAHNHLGGYILPGLSLSEHSIVSRAEKVFTVDDLVADPKPGRSTPAAVKNGALIGALGAIEYALAHHGRGRDVQLLLTGGDGLALHRHLRQGVYRPHLVFEGLWQWQKQG